MIKLEKYLYPYKRKLILMLVMLFLQVLGTLYLPTLTAEIVNNGIVKGDPSAVMRTGGFMLAVAVLAAAVSVYETYLSTSAFSAVGRDLRNDLYSRSQELTINEFNRIGSASMITRCTNDVDQIQHAFMESVEMLLPAPVMAVAGLILAFRKSPALAMLIVLSMFIACVSMVVVNNKALRLFSVLQKMLDKINRVLREDLTGIRDIRAYNRELYEQDRMDTVFREYSGTAIKVNRIFAILMPLIMGVMNLCTILILLAGGRAVSKGQMGIGDIMAIIEYAALILMYFTMGIMVFMDLPRAQTCARRVLEVFEIGGGSSDTNAPKAGALSGEGIRRLEFRNVTFQYMGADVPVLNNISFTAEAGKTTAVIGGTGSGKTTLINMIPRFYDAQSGTILVNGENILKIPSDELRRHIGFVPQKAYLFSGTIADNIRHGKHDASPEDIRRAAGTAQIGGFIESLEDGYETQVAQGGTNFSGGQRQRLSIARALVRKPDVYVFDDSFSALDYKTDSMLRAALKKEVGDAIVIIVAQRVSTIMGADQIIVLDKGCVAGIGTHSELMKKCDVYRKIAWSQLREEDTGEQ